MRWRRRKAERLPAMPESDAVERVEQETQEMRGLLRRLSISVAFNLDEHEFHQSGPADIDRIMGS